MAQLNAFHATDHRFENLSYSVHEVLPFGVPEIDNKLLGGGLSFSALHEITFAQNGMLDKAAATLFIAGIAARTKGKILWLLTQRNDFSHAFQQAGLDLKRVIFVEERDESKIITSMESALNHGGVTMVVGELSKLTAMESQKLNDAAAFSGAMAIILRGSMANNDSKSSEKSILARSSWRLSALPSISSMFGTRKKRWRIELMRCREGEYHVFDVETCDADGYLKLPAANSYRSNSTRKWSNHCFN